jgi:GDP-L-fucose synthase
MEEWNGKKVLVTGGSGFIGKHLVRRLVKMGADVSIGDIGNYDDPVDLTLYADALHVTKGKDIVLNLASKVAGIAYNSNNQAEMFHKNVVMGTNVMAAAVENNVPRFLQVSSACVYPASCGHPTTEAYGQIMSPGMSNEGYGWAKRMLERQIQRYHENGDISGGILRPSNAYGPGDHFGDDNFHVICSLIPKVARGDDPLVVWGSGKQTRSFVYVSDFVDAVCHFAFKENGCLPVNIGERREVSIKELVEIIQAALGSKAKVVFDKTKPEGQMRRSCDPSRAEDQDWYRKVTLEEGIKMTVDWYIENSKIPR